MTDYTVSNAAINLVAHFEGFRSRAYLCPSKVWTIGYGHTRGVKPGDVISEPDAKKLLKTELTQFAEGVKKVLGKTPVTQGQFDALVSLAYNIGLEGLKGSTVMRELKAGNNAAAGDAFMMWVKGAGGVTLPGLVRRRRDERSLFYSQPWVSNGQKVTD